MKIIIEESVGIDHAEKLIIIIPVRIVDDLESRTSSCINVIPNHVFGFDDRFNSLSNPDVYHFTYSTQIGNVIKNIINKKSCGRDGITNYINKMFPQTTIKLITYIINQIKK